MHAQVEELDDTLQDRSGPGAVRSRPRTFRLDRWAPRAGAPRPVVLRDEG